MGDSTNNRPAPTASGTLVKTPLVHLLVYALDKKLSGSIEFSAPDNRNAVVLFSAGEPLRVRTSEPVAYLGQVLRDLGFLGEEDLSRSLAELAKCRAAGPKLHGAVLLEMNVIDATKLRVGLAEQIGRKLHHVAAMPGDTAYAYYDGLDVLRGWGGDDAVPTDPVPHLWNMIREHTPWDHVNAAHSKLGTAALRLVQGANVARLRLTKEEAAAAELMRGRSLRPADLARAATVDERTARI